MQRGLACKPYQVAITLFVLSHHEKMVVPAGKLTMIFGFGEIKLATQDWFDVLLLHRVEEVDRAIDVAVVSHGRGFLAYLAQVAREFVDVTGAVQERVVSMKMEVGKLGGHASMLSLGWMRKTGT